MRINPLISGFAAVLALSATGSTHASAQSSGNVSVDITAVKADIARNLGVSVDDIGQNMVSVPPRLAANVCAVTEDTFKFERQAECSAKATSKDLDEAVRMLIQQ